MRISLLSQRLRERSSDSRIREEAPEPGLRWYSRMTAQLRENSNSDRDRMLSEHWGRRDDSYQGPQDNPQISMGP